MGKEEDTEDTVLFSWAFKSCAAIAMKYATPQIPDEYSSLQRKGRQALMTKEQKGEGKTSQKPVGKTCIKQNDLMVSEQSICSMLLKKVPISNGLDLINIFLS